MIQSITCNAKRAFSGFYKHLLETLFPPLCIACKERSDSKWFCHGCWLYLAPPDSTERCPHCFIRHMGLCATCQQKPDLSFTQRIVFEKSHVLTHLMKMEKETLASFAIIAWNSFDLALPDLVLPTPGSIQLCSLFSKMHNIPMSKALCTLHFDEELIEEDQSLLIFSESDFLDELMEYEKLLARCFPKKGMILRIFEQGGYD